MENLIVKVTISTQEGRVISEREFNTANIAEVKAFGDVNIVTQFIDDTINEIRDERRSNPHHHQNRLD